MAISTEFSTLFNKFVINYERNGESSYFSWSKEKNHQTISQYFNEFLLIITTNSELFHDVSVIDYLNSAILLSSKTNPYLLECWIKFLGEYNSETDLFLPINKIIIKILPEEKSSELMLESALSSLINLQEQLKSEQQFHHIETEKLKKQIEEIQGENFFLSNQNSELKLKIHDLKAIKSVQEVQEGIDHVQKLLSKISEKNSEKLPLIKLTSETQITLNKEEDMEAVIPSAPIKDLPKTKTVNQEKKKKITITPVKLNFLDEMHIAQKKMREKINLKQDNKIETKIIEKKNYTNAPIEFLQLINKLGEIREANSECSGNSSPNQSLTKFEWE